MAGVGWSAKWLVTAAVVLAAILAGLAIWQAYVVAPWTRDGRTRVQVANIAPQIFGQITQIHVRDNQHVQKGDLLYIIDPFDYRMAVVNAQAALQMRAVDLLAKRQSADRRQALNVDSTSIEEKQTFASNAAQAEAMFHAAQASLGQAQINLGRTEVRSPVTGTITNLQMRLGDYARTGINNLAVIDSESFWIDGYFEETKMRYVCVGEAATATLMGYDQPLLGVVESITRGINTSNATSSTQGLPDVNPVYTWVRLAQRIPVRVRITDVPVDVPLVAGMTVTVSLASPRYEQEARGLNGIRRILRNWLGQPDTSSPACNVAQPGPGYISTLPEPIMSAPTASETNPGLAPAMNKPPTRQSTGPITPRRTIQ